MYERIHCNLCVHTFTFWKIDIHSHLAVCRELTACQNFIDFCIHYFSYVFTKTRSNLHVFLHNDVKADLNYVSGSKYAHRQHVIQFTFEDCMWFEHNFQ